MKRLAGVLIFIVGGFLGGMTQTAFFEDAVFWQTMLALFGAFLLCGIGFVPIDFGVSSVERYRDDAGKK